MDDKIFKNKTKAHAKQTDRWDNLVNENSFAFFIGFMGSVLLQIQLEYRKEIS